MFTVGFKKTAEFDHNNQGLEFRMSDTTNASANVGPGGMSPQGIESYQPVDDNKEQPTNKKKKFKDRALVSFLMAKSAGADSLRSIVDGSGTGSPETLTSQLKWTSESPDMNQEEVSSKAKEESNRYKKYLKAKKPIYPIAKKQRPCC